MSGRRALTGFFALFRLILNFAREVVESGWATLRIILSVQAVRRAGFIRLSYGDLPDDAAALLAALVTLTPGTTVLEIDRERREFVLHLLDLAQADAVAAGIRHRFLEPLRDLWGLSQ